MDSEKIVGPSAIALPIIHLATCALFLAGYSAGFGANAGIFFTASDLFGLSVSELFWTYVSGLLLPIVALAPQLRPDYRSAMARAHDIGPDAVAKIERTDQLFNIGITLVFGIYLAFTLFQTFITASLDQSIPYMELSQPVVFLLTFSWGKYAAGLPTKRATDLLVAILLGLALVAFATGLTRGQGERRYPASTYADGRASCGEWQVLRVAGGRFLAVTKDERRALLDEECHPMLIFPKRDAFKSASLIDMVNEWWAAG